MSTTTQFSASRFVASSANIGGHRVVAHGTGAVLFVLSQLPVLVHGHVLMFVLVGKGLHMAVVLLIVVLLHVVLLQLPVHVSGRLILLLAVDKGVLVVLLVVVL
jgi:hypothetical protein